MVAAKDRFNGETRGKSAQPGAKSCKLDSPERVDFKYPAAPKAIGPPLRSYPALNKSPDTAKPPNATIVAGTELFELVLRGVLLLEKRVNLNLNYRSNRSLVSKVCMCGADIRI